MSDSLRGLVVNIPGYRSRGPGCYNIFWEVADLERGSLGLMRIIEEILE
jgi:hypothetical protein